MKFPGYPQPSSSSQTIEPGSLSANAKSQSVSMNALEKKIKKDIKKEAKSHKKSTPSGEGPSSSREIDPPRVHRDMRLICDVFRISEPSRYALRTFDAASLEDFALMTDEDYTDLIVTQARIGQPIPPLQQRKLRVLLSWAQSLATTEYLDKAETAIESSPNKTEGFEMRESKKEDGEEVLKASYKSSARKEGGKFIPSDWENRFYADLPRLKKELHQMGKERSRSSNWASGFLSLRWVFCG